jgi:hypothetical protein
MESSLPAGRIRPRIAIPTEYAGHCFRSRLEANVALFLDHLAIQWEYETRSFLLKSGRHYCPDFFLPKRPGFIEVKGLLNEEAARTAIEFVAESDQRPGGATELLIFTYTEALAIAGPGGNPLAAVSPIKFSICKCNDPFWGKHLEDRPFLWGTENWCYTCGELFEERQVVKVTGGKPYLVNHYLSHDDWLKSLCKS